MRNPTRVSVRWRRLGPKKLDSRLLFRNFRQAAGSALRAQLSSWPPCPLRFWITNPIIKTRIHSLKPLQVRSKFLQYKFFLNCKFTIDTSPTFHNTQHMSLLHLQKKIWKGHFCRNIFIFMHLYDCCFLPISSQKTFWFFLKEYFQNCEHYQMLNIKSNSYIALKGLKNEPYLNVLFLFFIGK